MGKEERPDIADYANAREESLASHMRRMYPKERKVGVGEAIQILQGNKESLSEEQKEDVSDLVKQTPSMDWTSVSLSFATGCLVGACVVAISSKRKGSMEDE